MPRKKRAFPASQTASTVAPSTSLARPRGQSVHLLAPSAPFQRPAGRGGPECVGVTLW